MTQTGVQESGLNGVLRLTRVTDQLEHVLQHSHADEPAGTWTSLACPDQGLTTGADVDNAALQRLAQGEIADLVWEAPPEFTAEHGQVSRAAILAHQAGDLGGGEELWQRVQALWTRAWSANYQALVLMQHAGLTRFSAHKPQRWVIASFEHHCGPHGLAHPHIHNIVITALTAAPG